MSKKTKKVKIRQFWAIDPTTKIESDKTQTYDRVHEKRELQKELDAELDAWEDFEEPQ